MPDLGMISITILVLKMKAAAQQILKLIMELLKKRFHRVCYSIYFMIIGKIQTIPKMLFTEVFLIVTIPLYWEAIKTGNLLNWNLKNILSSHQIQIMFWLFGI